MGGVSESEPEYEFEAVWRREMQEWARIIEGLDDDAFEQVVGALQTEPLQTLREIIAEFKDRRRLLKFLL